MGSRSSAHEELLDSLLHEIIRSWDRISGFLDKAYGSDVTSDSVSDGGGEIVSSLLPGGPRTKRGPNEVYLDYIRGQTGEIAERLIQQPLQG